MSREPAPGVVELDMLAEVVSGQLGPQGCFSHLTRERSEEILLLLLRNGRWVPAHKRAWTIPIPADLLECVHAAGGETLDEYHRRTAL